MVTRFGEAEVSVGEAIVEGVASGDGAMIWVGDGDGTPDCTDEVGLEVVQVTRLAVIARATRGSTRLK